MENRNNLQEIILKKKKLHKLKTIIEGLTDGNLEINMPLIRHSSCVS